MPAGFFMTDPTRIADAQGVIEQLPADVGVIFRHFGLAAQIELAPSIAALCHQQQRTFLVAADRNLARKLGADGVHWPGRLAGEASRYRDSGHIMTMSAHSMRDVKRAEAAGADAAIISTIFQSDSPSASKPIGVGRLAVIQRQSNIALYGLGGIDATNVERVARIAGFAAVSGFNEVGEAG